MRGRETLLHDLGRAVRAARTLRALTLRELSEQADVSIRFLADLEAGRGNVSVGRLHDIAVALGTSAAELLHARGERKVVSLLGLRGAGKSTIGKRLAKKLGVPFVELDREVEQAAGLTLAALFELHGEAFYRRMERAALERVLDRHDAAVLATGGSIVTDDETYALLRSRTHTVWLAASPASHWSRVVAQGDRRPMSNRENAKVELAQLLEQRRARYEKAYRVVDTDALGIDGVVQALAEAC